MEMLLPKNNDVFV